MMTTKRYVLSSTDWQVIAKSIAVSQRDVSPDPPLTCPNAWQSPKNPVIGMGLVPGVSSATRRKAASGRQRSAAFYE
jgi:hypothetical protein